MVEPKVVDEVTAKKNKKAQKPQKLTMANLTKDNKLLDMKGADTVTSVNGTVFEFTYDLKFRKTKQREMLRDIVKFFEEMMKEDVAIENGDADISAAYTTLMLVKHFTDLEIPDNVSDALATMEVMLDLGVLGPIVNALPDEEVQTIYDLLQDSLENLNKNLDQIDKEIEEASKEVENPQVAEFASKKLGDEKDTEEAADEPVAEENAEA